MPIPPIPPYAVDPTTKLYRLNHPAFLFHLVRCSLLVAREDHGARWWEPRTLRFVARNLRDRAQANAAGTTG